MIMQLAIAIRTGLTKRSKKPMTERGERRPV
jgi:hypothetical protein